MKDLRSMCNPAPKKDFVKIARNIVAAGEYNIEQLILADNKKHLYTSMAQIKFDDIDEILIELGNLFCTRQTQLDAEHRRIGNCDYIEFTLKV